MSDKQSTRTRFQMEFEPEELALLDRLVERVEARTRSKAGVHTRVTRRSVIIEGLEALDRELAEKERKR